MALDLDPASAGKPGAPRYAGFWIRVSANVLDVLALSAVNMAAVLAFGASAPASPGGAGSESAGVSDALVRAGTVIPALLTIAFWTICGATPGKMMLGLRIIDSHTGSRPTLWQCIGRYFVALLSTAVAGLGYLWILLDARSQAWHDKIVGTVVIRTRA